MCNQNPLPRLLRLHFPLKKHTHTLTGDENNVSRFFFKLVHSLLSTAAQTWNRNDNTFTKWKCKAKWGIKGILHLFVKGQFHPFTMSVSVERSKGGAGRSRPTQISIYTRPLQCLPIYPRQFFIHSTL